MVTSGAGRILYQGVKIWNDVPSYMENKTFIFLKRNYKKFILNQNSKTQKHILFELDLIRMTLL